MDTINIVAVLLFITVGVNTQVLVPVNETVLQNSNATFNCSASAPGWTVMTWTLNGISILTIVETSGPVVSNSRYVGTNYTTAGSITWGLLIKGVMLADNGTVGCQLQNSRTVFSTLFVQQYGTVTIAGSNVTATAGAPVTFVCQAAGWVPAATLSWNVNGMPVTQGLYNTTTTTNGNVTNSTLTFNAMNSVSVTCLASIAGLSSPQSSTSFLTVQNPVTAASGIQAVLIGTTVGFSLAALLALIIIGIVFFCTKRKRRRSTYQDELRAHTIPHRRHAPETRRPGRAVRENFGYVEDGPGVDNWDGVYAISGVPRGNHNTRIQPPVLSTPEYSSQYTNSSAYDAYSLDDLGAQKHRHLTMV